MDYSVVIKNYKNILLANTLAMTRAKVGSTIRNQTYTIRQAELDATKLTNDTFKFLEALLITGLVDGKTFDRVFARIANTAKTIDFLPEDRRGIYGQVIAEENKIYINPDLPDWKRTLYLFHELAHCCFKNRDNAPYIGNTLRHSTYYGYMTIEEALAQNIAETCYYASINQPRPLKHFEQDRIMPNFQYMTNYDYYGLYQPLAIAFGRVLRGVGTSAQSSDDTILFDLSKKALREDLLESVIEEYQRDGIAHDLDPMFFSLANVYSAKKMNFGMGGVEERVFDQNQNLIFAQVLNPTPYETQQHYTKALQIMKQNEDYRPVLEHNPRNQTPQ